MHPACNIHVCDMVVRLSAGYMCHDMTGVYVKCALNVTTCDGRIMRGDGYLRRVVGYRWETKASQPCVLQTEQTDERRRP